MKRNGGRLLSLELSSSLEELHKIATEDFGFEETDADLELNYLPIGLINSSECPPVIIGNSRQVQNFQRFCKKHQSTLSVPINQSKRIQIRSTLILIRCQLIHVLVKTCINHKFSHIN